MADIGGAFINAFATGASYKQNRRAQKDTAETNALTRKVTNENLLRANRTETRGVMDALRGQAGKGAAWAAQDPANRIEAFKAHMMRAYDMAEAQGTDPALIGRARQALQTVTADQLGPIAAQAMDFTKTPPETYGPVEQVPGAPEGTYGQQGKRSGKYVVTNKPGKEAGRKPTPTTAEQNLIGKQIAAHFKGFYNVVTGEFRGFAKPEEAALADEAAARAARMLREGSELSATEAADLAFKQVTREARDTPPAKDPKDMTDEEIKAALGIQ